MRQLIGFLAGVVIFTISFFISSAYGIHLSIPKSWIFGVMAALFAVGMCIRIITTKKANMSDRSSREADKLNEISASSDHHGDTTETK